MQLKCSHCPFIATSMIIGNDYAALSEVSNIFATHINKSHPDKATQLVKDHMHLAKVAMWLMTIAKHSTYLDEMEKNNLDVLSPDDPLEEAFDNQVEVLEELVGIEMFGNRPSGDDGDDNIEELVGDGLATPPPGALPL